MTDDSLGLFHPVSRRWFQSRFASPTRAQQAAWPLIASGRHLLVTAPTGSGKTLTAFFFALDALLSGRLACGATRILYISPLKALNNDIQRNLLTPLAELSARFAAAGLEVPVVRVMTRSGDTPETERRKMVAAPPEILITTPESLNILLTSKRGSAVLDRIETVILDEIHAVADNKRGTYLMTAVERLTRLSGEFQRIALSATVTPLDAIARFVGGYEGAKARDVAIVAPEETKQLSLVVRHAPPVIEATDDQVTENPGWLGAAHEIAARIQANRSTLVFANSRRGVERLARIINEAEGTDLVYAHHGSLSKEIRLLVEERLKRGDLKGVIATSSLELGIDVGHIDEVLMLESPFSTAAALQRLGRAGHGVGETSRGRLYVLYPADAVDAAVTAREVMARRVEPIAVPNAPLDVLAQVILSYCAHERWSLDALFDHIRCCAPYRELQRRLFDLVIEMLAGKYDGANVPALKPRLAVDAVTRTARTLDGATRLLYRSGGTIPDRGYFSVRIKETKALIGELDEEFVWERKLGDIITLGVQAWRITDITYSDVLVTHYKTGVTETPFWRCEERGSSAYFADIRAAFLEEADRAVGTAGFLERLETDYFLDATAASMVTAFLKAEKRALGVSLPHRRHIVVEKVLPRSTAKMAITVIHTEWGGKVNRPFAVALKTALSRDIDTSVQVIADDGAVAVALETEVDIPDLLKRVTADNVTALVREGIEKTGLFGAAFRENAARALLILRSGFGQRTPLWLNRKRAKALREKTAAFADFPINLETFRTVLKDEADLPALEQKLDGLHEGALAVSVVSPPRPSPFAEPLVYKLTNELMYDDDKLSEAASKTQDALIDAVLFSEALRPRIPAQLVDELTEKLQRRHIGYAPGSPLELISWVEERRLIPLAEWSVLLSAIERDCGLRPDALNDAVSHRIVAVFPRSEHRGGFVTTVSVLPMLEALFGIEGDIRAIGDPTRPASDDARQALAIMAARAPTPPGGLDLFLEQWLRFLGPVTIDTLETLLPAPRSTLREALALLRQTEDIVVDQLTASAVETEICHTATFRILLRMMRADRRRSISPRPIQALQPFLAAYQGLFRDANEMEAVLEQLFGWTAPPALFEQEIFPARIPGYRKADLDALLAGSNLVWVGTDKKQVYFALEEDRELFDSGEERSRRVDTELKEIFRNEDGRYTVSELEKQSGRAASDIRRQLERLAFKGVVSATTFAPLRRGVAVQPPTSVRPRFSKWKRSEPDTSIFYPLPRLDAEGDALDAESLQRERVRVLMARYGVVFKGLLERELPCLRWSSVFKTLRLMELSGEVVGGFFFEEIPGIQFLSQRALAMLQDTSAADVRIFWLNAKDPASLCGLGLATLGLPPRVQGTHLVYHGTERVVVSKRQAKHLEIAVRPDHPDLPRYLAFIEVLLTRDVEPAATLTIEKINGKPAATSGYREVFSHLFDTASTHRTLTVARRFT